MRRTALLRAGVGRALEFSDEGVVLLAVFLVFFNTLFNGYCGEDYSVIVGYDFHTTLRNLGALFSRAAYFQGSMETSYRPVVTLCYFGIYAIIGERPWGWHLFSVAVHALNAVLVLRLLRRVFPGQRWIALFGALLFATHSLTAEAVNGITYLEDPLVTLFSLTSIFFSLHYLERGGRARAILAGLALLVACLSKESGLVLLLLIPLVIHFCVAGVNRSPVRERAWRLGLVLVFFALCYGVLRFGVFTLGVDFPKPGRSLMGYWAGIVFPATYYLQRLFTPIGLIPFDWAGVEDFSRSALLWRTLAFFAFLVPILWVARQWRDFRLGLLFAAIPLAPVMNILWIHRPVAERFMYLPMIGVSICASAVVSRLAGLFRKPLSQVCLSLLLSIGLCLQAAFTVWQNRSFRDQLSYWSAPQPTWGQQDRLLGLAMAFRIRGEPDRALEALGQAERSLKYNHAFVFTEQALAHLYKGELKKALERSDMALDWTPRGVSVFYVVFRNHGEILLALGRNEAALQAFSLGARMNPFSADLRLGMARAALRLGQRASALEYVRQARRLNPGKELPAELDPILKDIVQGWQDGFAVSATEQEKKRVGPGR